MASPFDREQSSWPHTTVRRRVLNQYPQLLPIPIEAKENDLLANNEQQSTGRASQMTNHFQQLQVHAAAAAATSVPTRRAFSQPTTKTNYFERVASDFNDDDNDELCAEDLLFERLKQVINEYMVTFDRRFTYNSVMRWKIDYPNQVHYSVVISIDQPSFHQSTDMN